MTQLFHLKTISIESNDKSLDTSQLSDLEIWSELNQSNQYLNDTIKFITKLINHSKLLSNNVFQNGILIKISSQIFCLIFIELNEINHNPKVLLSILKFKHDEIYELIQNAKKIPSSYSISFIDEIKRDSMENLTSSASQLSVKIQQLKLLNIRQEFKRIITKEIKKKLINYNKSSQNDVAEICYRAMNFKFKNLLELNEKDEIEIKDWLYKLFEILNI
ncbi:hypothetical protein WICMUC_002919 [Wickerhamomyces mucosus]|uniref:Uncharacterized protein n=1 Tax=Wickerhamomyces mucosus TaxID=1378264 RepID=A0A9P8PP67_9ASCO|nr:hypothetical protein WICMUC_002919 [Wickerhamomyces mucosus]